MNHVLPGQGLLNELLHMVHRRQWAIDRDHLQARHWDNLATWVSLFTVVQDLTPDQTRLIYDLGVSCAIRIDRDENHRPLLLNLQDRYFDQRFGAWDQVRQIVCAKGVKGAA